MRNTMRDTTLRSYVEAMVPLSTLLLACMPLLGMRPMVLVIAFWLLVLFSRAALDPSPVGRNAWRWAGFLALPLLIMLPDLFRAQDLHAGWLALERSASLALFPIGFLLLGAPASDRFREAMMDVFTLAALLLALGANGQLLVHGLNDPDTGGGFSHAYRISFAELTGLHPPYASYFFLAAALFQLERLLDKARRPWWRVIAIVLLVMAGLLIGSRMPLFAFATALAAMLLVHLPRRKALRYAAVVFVGVGLLAAIMPGARQRVVETFVTVQHHDSRQELNSVNIRAPIAHCTMELLEDHWLLGLGQANVQRALDQCYLQFKEPMLLNGSYGTHNQLMHWWLCFGLAGLVLYIVFFGALLNRAWQRRDAAHLGFLVLLLVCSSTENILARQWGVVLFACFNTMFIAPDGDLPAQRR